MPAGAITTRSPAARARANVPVAANGTTGGTEPQRELTCRSVDLADLVHRLVVAEVPAGTYDGTSSGRTSWYGFARAVVRSVGLDPVVVHPMTSAAFVRAAPRPAFSVLAHDALVAAGVEPIGDWAERWAVAAGAIPI